MQGLPPEALDLLVRLMVRVCEDPFDRVISLPTGKDPHERMAELGEAGFVTFIVDEDAGLVRVYDLVWIG
ncbi:hypothetical protein [Actinomadura fibrosa]|uniref:Uncharacterized protein n=1 Tax=Actinomadura fibrosa TaxID=111802 RepID=A0ABW2XHT5_9ACTN|nr:hypothetical protein [Actinomadura fibrosa]